MSTIWKDPAEALMPLRQVMNSLLEDSFVWPGRLGFELFTGRTFPIDVYESTDKQAYEVKASLPGARPEEIEITASGGTLTIIYVTKGEEKVEKPRYVRHERFEGEMSRTITLPTHIDPDKVQASFESGVLTLHIPKSEAAKPKQIPLKAKEPEGAR